MAEKERAGSFHLQLAHLFFALAEIQQLLNGEIGQGQDRQRRDATFEEFRANFFENFWRELGRDLHHGLKHSTGSVFPENRRDGDVIVVADFDRRNDFFESRNHFLGEELAELVAVVAGAADFGGDQQKALKDSRKCVEAELF